MQLLSSHLLTAVIFLPLAVGLILLLVPGRFRTEIRLASLAASLGPLCLGVFAFWQMEGKGEFEFTEFAEWIPSIGASYRLGVDAPALLLMLLTSFLAAVSVIASWREIERRVKEFHILLLLLETGLLGTFASLDAFLFFVFWEVVLIPMYFIIGIWGSGDRVKAALKFVLFTMAGSALLLVAIIYMASVTGTFDLTTWYSHNFSLREQIWLFAAMAVAFAIKVPVIGLHSWLPDAHAEAPTAGSVLLAGILLKVGAYGFYRFAMPLFPFGVASFAVPVLTISVVSVIAGSLLALVQIDLKRLIAYSSISHMGLVMLGLFALERQAAAGSILMMVCHGLTVGALFMLAGMLNERFGSRLITDYGGLARHVPMLSVFFVFVACASIGVPVLGNFPAEFLILLGSFQTRTVFTAVAVAGVVLFACYMLRAVQRAFFGPAKQMEVRLADLVVREYLVLIPVAAIILWIGIWPGQWLEKVWQPADAFVKFSKRIEVIIPTSVNAPLP